MTMTESLELRVGEYTFSARAAGPTTGELVLLLHGFPETSCEWRHQLPALAAAGYRAVAPDQRGYAEGARPEDVAEYRIEKLALDAVGFADTLGVDRFHVVGHDWGGAVAWILAGNHGERLHTMTAVSTPHPTALADSIVGGEQRERSSYMLMFREEGSESRFCDDDGALLRGLYRASGLGEDDAVEEYVRVLNVPSAMRAALNWYRANNFRAPIGPVTVPTMYVWSTNDPALGREAAEATAACVDGPYRFEVIEEVGHWIPEAVPDTLNALLLSHLASG
jgi:pimeloyl-ACP methyl ester carboxylesterase